MSLIHYNVDKEPISLYCQEDINDIPLGDTTPEFLARFRRVKYDGTLYPTASLRTVNIPEGCKIVLKKDCTVGILFPSGTYYEFDNQNLEELRQSNFPTDQFGDFNSYIGITLENFKMFLDSYRVKSTMSSIKEAYVDIVTDETLEEDYGEIPDGITAG
jgi:hypothetical protein